MSTIASPRPSVTLSSRRTSTSTDTTVRSASSSRPAQPVTQRRNRAALRDYYGLKKDEQSDGTDSKDTLVVDELGPESDLDKPDFNPEQYVKDLLAKEGFEGLLRVEAGLLNDIRGFDGERKALVYDNYSKLIGATDTIKKMRTNMGPLAPSTSTLTPAISHIAQTAAALSISQGDSHPAQDEQVTSTERQRQTVRWVLEAPSRFQRYKADGRSEDINAEWPRVSALLDRWQKVDGAAEVRRQCEAFVR